MSNKKRRLSTLEVKKIIDHYRYGSHQGGHWIDNVEYTLDDIYDQFILIQDAVMSLVLEYHLLGKELK